MAGKTPVLQLVDQRLRVLHPDPSGEGLRGQCDTRTLAQREDVPGAVARGQDRGGDGNFLTRAEAERPESALAYDEGFDAGFEPHSDAGVFQGLA